MGGGSSNQKPSVGEVHCRDIFLEQHNAQLNQCLLLLNLPGLSKTDALDFARKMGFSENCMDQAAEWMLRLYDLFIEKDATMIEINPMSEDLLGRGKTSCHVYFTHSLFKDKNKMYVKNHFILKNTKKQNNSTTGTFI